MEQSFFSEGRAYDDFFLYAAVFPVSLNVYHHYNIFKNSLRNNTTNFIQELRIMEH